MAKQQHVIGNVEKKARKLEVRFACLWTDDGKEDIPLGKLTARDRIKKPLLG
ncbi:MAG: hypothetical protein ACP5SH_23000 [Syntrophobacteraceae bacterium]